MNFPREFRDWLLLALAHPVPSEVKAFSFNLFEPAGIDGVTFGIELVGAAAFDPNDSDWACDEVWAVQPRKLNIPSSFSGADWEKCLEKVKAMVESALEAEPRISNILKSRQAIAVGFVDGDLDVIWSS